MTTSKEREPHNPFCHAVERAGCFRYGSTELSSGLICDKRLDLKKLYDPKFERELKLVLDGMQSAMQKLRPDALVGVPGDGERLAVELAVRSKIPVLNQIHGLSDPKESQKSQTIYESDQGLFTDFDRIVVVQGVSVTNLTLNNTLQSLADNRADVVGSVILWRSNKPVDEGGYEDPIITGDVEYLIERFIYVGPQTPKI